MENAIKEILTNKPIWPRFRDGGKWGPRKTWGQMRADERQACNRRKKVDEECPHKRRSSDK